MIEQSDQHIPVLLTSVIGCLKPQIGESYLDLTAGYGGHATAIVEHTNNPKDMTLVDRDRNAIASLQPLAEQGAVILHGDFLAQAQKLRDEGKSYDMILLDLGISSPHVDNAERGFSLLKDGPLDMRMDQSQAETAADLVNTASRDELIRIFRDYGEERRAVKVADAVIATRPHSLTLDFAEVVRKALPGPRKKVHPATKIFQAIRIAVNDELTQLEHVLPVALDLLAPSGRLAVISFHSLEDRAVKRFFKEESSSGYESRIDVVTKRPIDGSIEDAFNPRARSAKLRVAIRKPR